MGGLIRCLRGIEEARDTPCEQDKGLNYQHRPLFPGIMETSFAIRISPQDEREWSASRAIFLVNNNRIPSNSLPAKGNTRINRCTWYGNRLGTQANMNIAMNQRSGDDGKIAIGQIETGNAGNTTKLSHNITRRDSRLTI